MSKKQVFAVILTVILIGWLAVHFHALAGIVAVISWLQSEAYSFYIAIYIAMDIVKASALVLAICALIIAWNNYRRGNWAIVKLVHVSAGGTQKRGVNGDRLYDHLDVEIKNLGIPLKKVRVSIAGFCEHGSINVPLQQFEFDEIIPFGGSLEKGMIARFGLRSFGTFEELAGLAGLCSLDDPHATDINIVVSSNGYVVKRFRVDVSSVKARRMWNRFAFAFNRALTTKKKMWGREFTCDHSILPLLHDLDFQFRHFIKSVKAHPPQRNL